MRRAETGFISMAAATATTLALLAGSAAAGSYVVTSCSPSGSPSLWTPVNTFPNALGVGNRCRGPAIGSLDASHDGALYAEDVRSEATAIPNGSRAGWLFSAPPGTEVTAISLHRRLAAAGDPDLVAGLYQANGIALEECKLPWPADPYRPPACSMPNEQVPVTFGDLRTNALFLGVGCRIERPVSACGKVPGVRPAVQADLYSAEVTLSESTPPAIGEVGGALWGGGVVSGVVAVRFTASDLTGIREQSVRTGADSTLISTLHPCDFTVAQPCPQQPGGSLDVDTTGVADGPQTFSLNVTDAAGNMQVATSPPVVVDNDGPPPPIGLTATPDERGSNAITLAWRNPSGAPAPITQAMVQVCRDACPAATTIGASGSARITAPAAGRYSVRLWLVDGFGRGGPHNAALASVRIPPPPADEPAVAPVRSRISAVLKGRRLHITGALAGTGRARIGWHALRGDRVLGRGSRVVTIREHQIAATFTLGARARSRTTVIRATARIGNRIVARSRARRG